MQIFIGYDPRDDLAAKVCIASIKRHASKATDIRLIKDNEVRKSGMYTRPYTVTETGQMIDGRDTRPFSTLFAFTRFLTPYLALDHTALFVDADFMFRDDVCKLFEYQSDSKAVSCVHHEYAPRELKKMDGVSQGSYRRKNWSSLMLMNSVLCRGFLDLHDVNYKPGRWLHGLEWLSDEFIGEIPEEWNWLEGWSAGPDPKAVHFTRGTPDMIGGSCKFSTEWNQYAASV